MRSSCYFGDFVKRYIERIFGNDVNDDESDRVYFYGGSVSKVFFEFCGTNV